MSTTASIKVNKYETTENIVLFNTLLLKGDILFIQEYDPVNGRPQSVFLFDRKHIGSISPELFFQLKKKLNDQP